MAQHSHKLNKLPELERVSAAPPQEMSKINVTDFIDVGKITNEHYEFLHAVQNTHVVNFLLEKLGRPFVLPRQKRKVLPVNLVALGHVLEIQSTTQYDVPHTHVTMLKEAFKTALKNNPNAAKWKALFPKAF